MKYKVQHTLRPLKIANPNEVKGTMGLQDEKSLKLKDYHVGKMKVCQFGSINIAGISNIKVYMLLAIHTLDILCVQETWLTSSTVKLDIPGYQVYEERRQTGKRGGIAMLVRKGIKIIRYIGNEYAQGICL